MGCVSAVWGWQRVTHCLWSPPLEGVHIKNGMTEAEKGVQPPELVRGQGARRKFQSSGSLSAGKTNGFRGGLPGREGGQCEEISINWLQPSRNKPPRPAAFSASCLSTQRRPLGNKWSAVDTHVLTPVNINGSFVYVLIAKEA